MKPEKRRKSAARPAREPLSSPSTDEHKGLGHVSAHLIRIGFCLGRLERLAAIAQGLTASQLRVLVQLEACPSLATLSQLADMQALAPSTMTRNVALLERSGLVMRRTSEGDHRVVEVHLTERGHELARACEEALRRLVMRALAAVGTRSRDWQDAIEAVCAQLEQELPLRSVEG